MDNEGIATCRLPAKPTSITFHKTMEGGNCLTLTQKIDELDRTDVDRVDVALKKVLALP
jgi:hypothetical protein